MRVVLISLDAAFQQDFPVLAGLPHIGQLIKDGVSCDDMETIYPALTYPIHVSIITGKNPESHGIGHNQLFKPELPGEMRPWYWENSQIQGKTLFDAMDQAGKKCASILWPVTGKNSAIRWNFPEVLALPGESQVVKMLKFGTPLWILATELRYGKKRVSTKEPYLSDYAALLAEKLLSRRKPPDFLALHLVDLDAARHRYRVNSPEAMEALHRLDHRVGNIVNAVKAAGRDKDTVFCLVSDHGQADVDTPICLKEKLAGAGCPYDVQVQSLGMGAYVFPKKPEEKRHIAAFLRENMETIGASQVYSRQDLDKMGAVKTVPLAVEAATGLVYVDHLEPGKGEKATHGFAPNHPAAKCLFIMCGPNIPKGQQIAGMKVTMVAKKIADVMGVAWP